MKISAQWLGERYKFSARNERGLSVVFDVPSENSPGEGPMPMEVYLQALAVCSGMDVVGILRKRRLKIERLMVEAEAERADQHPKIFTRIVLKFRAAGEGLSEQELERAVKLSMDKYCSVKAMIDPAKTAITAECFIDE